MAALLQGAMELEGVDSETVHMLVTFLMKFMTTCDVSGSNDDKNASRAQVHLTNYPNENILLLKFFCRALFYVILMFSLVTIKQKNHLAFHLINLGNRINKSVIPWSPRSNLIFKKIRNSAVFNAFLAGLPHVRPDSKIPSC